MNRSLPISLIFLFAGGNLLGQQDEDPTAVQRSKMEVQFEELDMDGDGTLSEDELDGFSKKTLGRMREMGLRQGYPLIREEFVTAGIAHMVSEAKKDREKDEDRSQRRELKLDESSSTSPPESATSSPTGSRRTSSGKSRFVPRLPAEYQARDKNGDGQIGLYEWDRTKYAEFAKLDKNGDGFLTAAELLSKTTANLRTSDRGSMGTNPPAIQSPTEKDPLGTEARDSFTRMDKNSDGGIGEDEWATSQRVRPMFENAGINASLPMDVETFVANYRRAKISETPR